MPCVGCSVEPLSERKRLQHGDGLMLAKNKSSRALDLSDDVDHLGLWNRDNIMRENADILCGVLGFHDLLQVHLSHSELSRRVRHCSRQGNATPLELPCDAHAVSCVRPNSTG